MSAELNQPIMVFDTVEAWWRWLEEEASVSSGLWMQIAKKGSTHSTISYDQALEVALCFGWIDGQKKGLDDAFWLQRFTPRGKRSIWSKINREKAERLIIEGRMQPSGIAEVERAKADGRWDAAYESQSKIAVPDDLQVALDANPKAKAFFESLNSVNRYAILFRIHNVKKAETRAKKIAQFVQMLADEKSIYP